MDLSKSYEFFQPEMVDQRIHIIGCGAGGSALAEILTRYGLTEFSLYDFDKVEAKNINNQLFLHHQIGMPKVDAVEEIICSINPEATEKLRKYPEGYSSQRLSGYVFLCVDNIDLRRKIAEAQRGNAAIKAMFDFRMALTDGLFYAADWSNPHEVKAFINSMQFTHEEAKEQTPVSACGTTLSVPVTPRLIAYKGAIEFIKMVKGESYEIMIPIDTQAPFSSMSRGV